MRRHGPTRSRSSAPSRSWSCCCRAASLRTRAVREQIAPVLTLGIAGTAATFGLVAVAAHRSSGSLDAGAPARSRALADRSGRRVRCRLARGCRRRARRAAARGRGGVQRPVAIALTLALVTPAAGAAGSTAGRSRGRRCASCVVGAVVGLAAGFLSARVLGPRWPTLAMAPPLAVLAGGFATFGLGALAHGSGFVAVYLFGLVLGDDVDLPQAERCARSASNSPRWPRSRCS